MIRGHIGLLSRNLCYEILESLEADGGSVPVAEVGHQELSVLPDDMHPHFVHAYVHHGLIGVSSPTLWGTMVLGNSPHESSRVRLAGFTMVRLAADVSSILSVAKPLAGQMSFMGSAIKPWSPREST